MIASDTCDLETAVAENRFYPGLYYYLNAGRIDIPPLRHRQEDILAMAEHFLAKAVFMRCRTRNANFLAFFPGGTPNSATF